MTFFLGFQALIMVDFGFRNSKVDSFSRENFWQGLRVHRQSFPSSFGSFE